MAISKNFLTPQLPLNESGELEYEHIGEYRSLIQQNFKNLILTIPGERTMDPDFCIFKKISLKLQLVSHLLRSKHKSLSSCQSTCLSA